MQQVKYQVGDVVHYDDEEVAVTGVVLVADDDYFVVAGVQTTVRAYYAQGRHWLVKTAEEVKHD